jgi:hypothetical protein
VGAPGGRFSARGRSAGALLQLAFEREAFGETHLEAGVHCASDVADGHLARRRVLAGETMMASSKERPPRSCSHRS